MENNQKRKTMKNRETTLKTMVVQKRDVTDRGPRQTSFGAKNLT